MKTTILLPLFFCAVSLANSAFGQGQQTPPTISPQPASQTVAQWATATFTAGASGTAPLSYQWSKDGVAITHATDSAYSITNVQGPNIGSYTVVVTNGFGSATSTAANLSIQGVPSELWQGLIAYYPFNGNASDASGHGNNGNPTNVVFNSDRFGNANASADFSSGNAYVEIPTLNAMSYYPVTYSLWFKLNRYPLAAERRSDGWSEMTLMGREMTTTFNDGALCLYNQVGYATNEILYYTGQSDFGSRRTPPTNEWVHLVFTVDANDNQTFYWNGQLLGTNAFTYQQNAVLPFRIGASASFADYRLGWKGSIDDVRIYNRALSSNEVAELYSSEAPSSSVPPSIQAQPQGKTTSVGLAASFSVTAIGPQPLAYQWLLNSSPITGATNSSYAVSNPQLSDDGSSYSVIITNNFGAVTSAVVVLTVGAAPTISPQPASQTVAQGATATFTAGVSGAAPFGYQWKKDGVAITGATDSAYSITNVQGPNIGSYTVVVTNGFGSATSTAAGLSIEGVPSELWQGLIAYYPFNGNASDASGHGNNGNPTNVVFNSDRFGNTNASADFSSGNAYVEIPTLNAMSYYPVTYSLWFKLNRYPLAAERRSDGWSEMTLMGREMTTTFTQGALCLYSEVPYLTNEIIYYTGQTGFGSGRTPPTNEWVHLVFTVDANDNQTFYWNGQLLGTNAFTYQQNAVLPFRIGASASFADYRLGWKGSIDDVRIYNRALSSNEVTELYSTEAPIPPSVSLQPTSQSVVVGNAVTLTGGGTGTGPLSYQWTHNGANILGTTTTSLTIANVQQSDAGSYGLVVSSPYGSATSSNAVLSVVTSTLVVGNVSGTGSSTIQVPVSLFALGTENALGFSLNFDPTLLSISGVALGADASGATIFANTNQQGSGRCGIVVSYNSGGTFASGTQEVAVVTFNVGIVATNTVTAITLGDSPTVRQISDSLANSLPGTYVSGSATLSQTVFEGDLSPRPNGDQRVTITDWVQVGRFVAGLDTVISPSEFQRADCAPRNTLGNGQLTVSDWVQAGRYAVGLDPLTPVGGPTQTKGNAVLTPHFPTSRTITLQTSAGAGSTNVVSVQMNSQGDENAVGFSLSFDSQLVRFTGATLGSGATGATMNLNSVQATNGTIGVALELPFGQSFAAGTEEVVRLSFVPVVYSPGMSNLTFTDSPVIREVSDATANQLVTSYVSSTLSTTGLLPSLAITQDGSGNVTLSWPAGANGYGLESVSDLSTNWVSVSANAVTNGASVFVTQPAATNQLYFRLHHP